MFQSIKGNKSGDRQINKLLAQTIGKYSPLPSQVINIRKPLPTIYSKFEKDEESQVVKNEVIVGKYLNIKQNLKEYRQIVKDYLSEEQNKNLTFYQQLKIIVEKSKFKTQNFIRNKIKEVQKIFDQTLLDIQHKLYLLKENNYNINQDQEQKAFQNIKQFQLPIFTLKYVDVKVFQSLIHSYTMIIQQSSNIQNVKAKFAKNKQNIPQNQKKQKIQKQQKYIYKYTQNDLLCQQDLDWECLTDRKKLDSLIPSNIIPEQSQSQQSSLISTTDFV